MKNPFLMEIFQIGCNGSDKIDRDISNCSLRKNLRHVKHPFLSMVEETLDMTCRTSFLLRHSKQLFLLRHLKFLTYEKIETEQTSFLSNYKLQNETEQTSFLSNYKLQIIPAVVETMRRLKCSQKVF